MELKQVAEVAKRYGNLFGDLYGYVGVRLSENLMRVPLALLSDEQRRQHVAWMCWELEQLVSAGKTEKAMRWLGFIQGAMWALGIRTIEQLKYDNMPANETFDGSRV